MIAQISQNFVQEKEGFFVVTPEGGSDGAQGFVSLVKFGAQLLEMGPPKKILSKVTPRNWVERKRNA